MLHGWRRILLKSDIVWWSYENVYSGLLFLDTLYSVVRCKYLTVLD